MKKYMSILKINLGKLHIQKAIFDIKISKIAPIVKLLNKKLNLTFKKHSNSNIQNKPIFCYLSYNFKTIQFYLTNKICFFCIK